MKKLAWAGLASLAFHLPVAAQNLVNQAGQQNAFSRMLSARATQPVLGRCDTGGRDRCFRIFIELTPKDDREIGVAAQDYSTAYAASGAQCKGYALSGVYRDAHDSLRNRWDLRRITYTDKFKPAIAIMEFTCDNAVLQNEEITIQVVFDIYVDARENGEGRYIFSRVRLTR